MKKLTLYIIFCTFMLPLIAQTTLHINGYVYDSTSGNPVQGHLVTIRNDTLNGGYIFPYIKSMYTNSAGMYADTILLPAGITAWPFILETYDDCNGGIYNLWTGYNGGTTVFTHDFMICVPGPCHAEFAAVPGNNNLYNFFDQSSSDIISWEWNFGDPASGAYNISTLQNSTHTYSQTGTYTPCLTVYGTDTTCFDIKCKPVVVGSDTAIYLIISGTVTNGLTSTPMSNHAVTWGIIDTLSGPRTVYTNSNGYYADAMMLPPGVNSGNYYVWTQDCQSYTQISSQFSPIHLQLQQDFFLSCETNMPCQAKMKVLAAGILTAQFQDKSTGGVSSRTWDFGDGVTSTLENPIHTYNSQGDFLVTLSTTNNITGCSSTALRNVNFADSLLCKASFSSSNTLTPRTIQFQDQSSGATGFRHWNFGDGDTSTLANPAHTYRYPGLYMAVLSVGDYTLPCWTSCAGAILVTDSVVPCQAGFTYTTSPATGPKMVQFTDQSTGTPSHWQWYFGDGDSSSQRYPIHSYATPGTYHVCLTITGDYCASTFCQDIIIQDSLVLHQVYGQVFAGNFPVTAGLALIVSFDSTGSSPPYVDISPIDTNGVYYFTTVPPGNYYISATPSDSTGNLPTYYGNTITWEQASLITLGTENNPYNINLVQSDPLTSGPGSASGQINMGDMSSSMVDKVNMMLLNAEGASIGFTPVSISGAFSFPSMAYGTYYLHAELPGITSDYVMIHVTPEKPHAEVVMTFSGSRIIGIRDETGPANRWSVYPNPVADQLTISIDMKNRTTAEVGIYNISGKMVAGTRALLHEGTNNIGVSTASLPSGIYSLRINSRDGLILTTKVLKMR